MATYIIWRANRGRLGELCLAWWNIQGTSEGIQRVALRTKSSRLPRTSKFRRISLRESSRAHAGVPLFHAKYFESWDLCDPCLGWAGVPCRGIDSLILRFCEQRAHFSLVV